MISEHGEMVLPPLTFKVDSTMNLISRLNHECERREHNFLYSGITKELLLILYLKLNT